MKKVFLLLAAATLLMATNMQAKDIRVVEISTGSGMSGANYDSSIQTILKTVAGVSKIVSDVANLVLTITYDADQIGVDEIVTHINTAEPRFEAKQKSEPKTKKWVKAERKAQKAEEKVEQERQEARQRDEQRGNSGGSAPQAEAPAAGGQSQQGGSQPAQGGSQPTQSGGGQQQMGR